MVVLDKTDFRYLASEVELLTEDVNKAYVDINIFLARYV